MAEQKAEKFVELLITFYGKFFTGTSDAVDTLIDIEKNYPDEYKIIKDFGDNPDAIGGLIEELSLEKQSLLLKLLLKSGKFARDFANLLNLNEEEKRKLSKDLKSFAEEIKGEAKK